MPAENWNGKFMMMGNGGFAGSIQGYGDMQVALRARLRCCRAMPDIRKPKVPTACSRSAIRKKIIDFSHRAVHETTVTSKQLIKEFYSRAAQYS